MNETQCSNDEIRVLLYMCFDLTIKKIKHKVPYLYLEKSRIEK